MAGCTAFTTSAGAAVPPPDDPFESRDWPATLIREPVSSVALGELRIELEATTLDQVRRAASVGSIAHRGDTGDSIYWLCYTIDRKQPTDQLWIISVGEISGDDRRITGIASRRSKRAAATRDCPSLPNALRPVSLDSGVWLGTSLDELDSTFGAPSRRVGTWRSYDFRYESPGDCGDAIDNFDVVNWVSTRSERGSVVELHVGRITSC